MIPDPISPWDELPWTQPANPVRYKTWNTNNTIAPDGFIDQFKDYLSNK